MKILKTVLMVAGIAGLAALPFVSGRLIEAIKGDGDTQAAELKDLKGEPANEWHEAKGEAKAGAAAPADEEKARDLYLTGMKSFQNGDYVKAKAAWQDAAKLDPYNEDVKNGLKRIKHIKGE